jgi:hypothetical protein
MRPSSNPSTAKKKKKKRNHQIQLKKDLKKCLKDGRWVANKYMKNDQHH